MHLEMTLRAAQSILPLADAKQGESPEQDPLELDRASPLKNLNAAGVPRSIRSTKVFDDAQVQHLGFAQDVPNAGTA
jgi:hypothetical protein